jgi:hypothetical protein
VKKKKKKKRRKGKKGIRKEEGKKIGDTFNYRRSMNPKMCAFLSVCSPAIIARPAVWQARWSPVIPRLWFSRTALRCPTALGSSPG